MKEKSQNKLKRTKERAKEKGEVYYSEWRLLKMKNASTVRTILPHGTRVKPYALIGHVRIIRGGSQVSGCPTLFEFPCQNLIMIFPP